MSRHSVLIVRGHLVTPWELRMWEPLTDRFDIAYLYGKSNAFDPGELSLRPVEIATRRDRAPKGRVGELVTGVIGDDYIGLEEKLAGFDIVQGAELSFWFAASIARAKAKGGSFKLLQTVWETIPFRDAYRNRHARKFRDWMGGEARRYLRKPWLFLAALTILPGLPAALRQRRRLRQACGQPTVRELERRWSAG